MKEFMVRDDELDPKCLDLVVQEVIKEFDCDADGALSYQECLNIFLPATSEEMRRACAERSTEHEPDTLVLLLASKIVRYETSLAFQKLLYRRLMANDKEFDLQCAYNTLCTYSNERKKIDMVAMKNFLGSLPLPTTSSLAFLEQARKIQPNLNLADVDPNIVYGGPQEQLVVHDFHLEAIRRRCDHDGDRKLSFSEFHEVVKGIQASTGVKSETFYSL